MKLIKNKKIILTILVIAIAAFLIFVAIKVLTDNSGDKDRTDFSVQNSENQDINIVSKEIMDSAADNEAEAENFTLMVYICGSDLESKRAYATNSINQILEANTGKNLQIIVETGGAKRWKNDTVKSDALYRYEVRSNKLQLLGDAGNNPITDASCLSDFIKFAAKEKPADRYGFIFWNHGGGTIGGYGEDMLFDSQSMNINEIKKGFEDAGIHFDFIGFDCCLMSTVEIANALKSNADYLIASEETEPGSSWYYTDTLNLIENNPKASVKSIAKQFISDFNSPQYTETSGDTTLALIDLSRIDEVINALDRFFDSTEQMLLDGRFDEIAKARIEARSFGKDRFEQIDIIDYVKRLDNAEYKDAVISAVENAVLYRESRSADSNGLAMFFPYYILDKYTEYRNLILEDGLIDNNHIKFFDDFVSVEIGGRTEEDSNPYLKEDESSDSYDFENQNWYNEQLVNEYKGYYSYIDDDSLMVKESEDGYLIALKDSDWGIISDIELRVYLNYDDGYLMLGSDDYFEMTDTGELVIDYDCKWLHVNDCLASYYALEKENFDDSSIGYMPAYLNDEEYIYIWVMWTEDGCELLGYTSDYDDVSAKGYFQFDDGDLIEFLFNFYSYDGVFVDEYLLTDNAFVYNSDVGFWVYYDEIGDSDTQVCFYIKDIYQNDYWTEPVIITGGN